MANYGGGSVASFRISEDGSLSEAVSFFQHEGSSVNERRQKGPHAHSINVDPANKWAYAAALSLHFRNGLLVVQALLSVPAALSGGIVAAWWSGQDVSIATLVGLIAVAGIAARNVIMLLTRYQSLAMEEGMAFGGKLIMRGTVERVAPILMTALTAAFALVPLALAGGAPGKEILQPMAIVMIGGLVSSTLLSLVLTPAAYRLLGDDRRGVPTSS